MTHSKRFVLYVPVQSMTEDYSPMEREKNFVTEEEWLRYRNQNPSLDTEDLLSLVERETGRDPDYFYHRMPDETVCTLLKKIPNVSIHPVVTDRPATFLENESIQMFCQDFLDKKGTMLDLDNLSPSRLIHMPADDAVLTDDPKIFKDRAEDGRFTILLTEDSSIKPVMLTDDIPVGIPVDPKSRYTPGYIRSSYDKFYLHYLRQQITEAESMSYLTADPAEKKKMQEEWLLTHDPNPDLASVGYLKQPERQKDDGFER